MGRREEEMHSGQIEQLIWTSSHSDWVHSMRRWRKMAFGMQAGDRKCRGWWPCCTFSSLSQSNWNTGFPPWRDSLGQCGKVRKETRWSLINVHSRRGGVKALEMETRAYLGNSSKEEIERLCSNDSKQWWSICRDNTSAGLLCTIKRNRFQENHLSQRKEEQRRAWDI